MERVLQKSKILVTFLVLPKILKFDFLVQSDWENQNPSHFSSITQNSQISFPVQSDWENQNPSHFSSITQNSHLSHFQFKVTGKIKILVTFLVLPKLPICPFESLPVQSDWENQNPSHFSSITQNSQFESLPVQSDWENQNPSHFSSITQIAQFSLPVQSDWENQNPSHFSSITQNSQFESFPVQSDWENQNPSHFSSITQIAHLSHFQFKVTGKINFCKSRSNLCIQFGNHVVTSNSLHSHQIDLNRKS